MNAVYTTQFIKENKSILFGVLGTVLFLAFLYYIVVVNKQTSQFFGNNQPTPTPVTEYPTNLGTSLKTVLNSKNLHQAAKEEKLAIKDNELMVVITLKDESFVFTDQYGTEQFRYGKNIQAYVKFDKLKELAQNPKIATMTAPLKSADNPND